MANTANDVPFFERYERLLDEGNDLGSLLDAFYVEDVARSIRRARFSYGGLMHVDVRQHILPVVSEPVVVRITSGFKLVRLSLKHEDGFVTHSSGGLFVVDPDSTVNPNIGLAYGDAIHGSLSQDCKTSLMMLGLGLETTRLFDPD